MLEIRFRLIDDSRDCFHALTQIGNPFFRRIEIPRDEKIEAVGQALVVNERVPLRLFQFFQIENLIVDVFAKNAHIDLVGAAKLRNVIEFLERLAGLFRAGKESTACLR